MCFLTKIEISKFKNIIKGKMVKKILYTIVAVLMSYSMYAATINAISSGDWNAGATWAKICTGTITTNNTSTTVTGVGTSFTTDLQVGNRIYSASGVLIGTVSSITDNLNLVLAANAISTNVAVGFVSSWENTCTGTITTSNTSTSVTGVGTSFTTELQVGSEIRTTTGVLIGIVSSITDNSNLMLVANATSTNAGVAYKVGGTPTVSDDVVIPVGLSITRVSTILNYNSLSVSGILTISSGDLDVTSNHTVIIINGGVITITGAFDLKFTTNVSTPSFIVSTGGTLNVGGNISSGDNTSARTFINSGYVEVGGSVTSDPITLTNNITGVLLIHGGISSAGSVINIYNYGIVTVDKSFTLGKTNFINYITGKFFVFGDVTVDNSSTFTNYGLIQCNTFSIANSNFVNATCSSSLTGTITVANGSSSVTGTGTLFTNDLVVGSIITNTANCYVIGTVASITDDTHLVLVANARNSYTSVNYGLSLPGTLIALSSFTESSNSCPGCDNLNTMGNLYYKTYSINSPNWCNGSSCESWFLGQSTVQPISPGRRIWLAPDFIGYGLGSDGQLIKRWFDLANTFGFYMSQSNTSYQPILKNNATDNLNFNPVVSFSTGEKHLDLNSHPLECNSGGGGGLSMFAVTIPASGSTGTPAIVDYGLRTTNGYGLAYSAQNAFAYTATSTGSGNGVAQTYAHTRTTKPTLLSTTTAWNGNQSMFIDGLSVVTTSGVTLTQLTSNEINEASPATATNGPFTLGWSSTTSNTFDYEGTVGDIIVYANCVSSTIQEATQSFLALKYGITLSHAYRDYVGNIVRAIDATYNNDIAGLAREDMNILHQRKSKSCNPGAELTISTAAIDNSQYNQKSVTTNITNNRSYLIWGHNGGSVSDGSRIYKITASNFKQKVYLQFAISGLASTPILVVADDPAFTTNVNGIYGSYDGTYLTYNTIFSNNKSQYFKLLISATSSTPGVLITSTSPMPTIKNTAELEVYSTSKGILLPSMAISDTATISKVTGLLFYNTTHNRFMYYNGTAWKFVGAPLKQTSTDLMNSNGYYIGELRYNVTRHTMCVWDGNSWNELNHN